MITIKIFKALLRYQEGSKSENNRKSKISIHRLLFLAPLLFFLYIMKIKQYKRVIDSEQPTQNLVIIYFMLDIKYLPT